MKQRISEISVKPNNYSRKHCLSGSSPAGFILAPGVSHPVQTVQLVVPELQSIVYIRRLLLHGHKPGPLLQNLTTKSSHRSAHTATVSWRPTGARQRWPYLALSGWNGLGLVSAHVVIDAPLELLSDQSAIFPAALRVW